MHVEEVKLVNFLGHAETTALFPAAGVVAVVGKNGHGKSSLVEAVSYALWGKTLRGSDPWASSAYGSVYARVRVGLVRLHVTRTVKKSKEALSWHVDGQEPTKYETATKAQDALELFIGAHAVWRRASVFSSADADSFSSATDAERKRMLESVLGVDQFDPALKACRADLAQAEAASVKAERDHAVALERLSAARTRKADATKTLAASGGEDAAVGHGPKVRDLRALLQQTDSDLTGMRAKLREGDRAGAEHAATARQLQQMLERLRGARCPTCEQPITEDYRARLARDQQAASARAASAAQAAKAALAEVEAGLAEVEAERTALAARVAEAESRARVAEATRQQRVAATKALEEAQAVIAEYEQKAAAAHAALTAAEAECAELRACERALGLKGPRAQIVAKALGGLEAVANAWLDRIAAPGLRVRLSPFTETKTAGVNDRIAFEVEGAGGGHGYRAASGGERRRLDVALLLALGEFVASANGRDVGTLFADEVFDALDEEGRAAVSAALHTLAHEGRSVVVVTHLPAFVAELGPSACWRVVRGKLTAA